MELGCDGVLLNTGIAGAQDPLRMAEAMKLATKAGVSLIKPAAFPRNFTRQPPVRKLARSQIVPIDLSKVRKQSENKTASPIFMTGLAVIDKDRTKLIKRLLDKQHFLISWQWPKVVGNDSL